MTDYTNTEEFAQQMFVQTMMYYVENVNMYLLDNEVKLLAYLVVTCFQKGNNADNGGFRVRVHYDDMETATQLDKTELYYAMETLTAYDIVIEVDTPTSEGALYGIGASPNIEGLRKRKQGQQ